MLLKTGDTATHDSSRTGAAPLRGHDSSRTGAARRFASRVGLALQYAVAGPVSGQLNVSRNKDKRQQEGPSNKSSIPEDPPVTTVLKETTTVAPATSTAVVSDSSSAESSSEEEEAHDTMAGDDDAFIVETTTTSSLERSQVIKYSGLSFWNRCICMSPPTRQPYGEQRRGMRFTSRFTNCVLPSSLLRK